MSLSGLDPQTIQSLISLFGSGPSPDQVSQGLGGVSLPTPPTYNPVNIGQSAGTGQLDQSLISLLQSQNTLGSGGINSALQAILPQITNNPYTPGLLSAAQNAGAAAGQQGAQDISGANSIAGLSNDSLASLQQLLATSFDPQNQLHDSLTHQLTDNVNAGLAGSGLLGSPVGQGVLGQDLGNFDINWQNNLLNRMVTGLGAYGGGVNTLTNNLTGAANLGNTGVNDINQAGQLPYGAYTSQLTNQISPLLQLLNGQNSQFSSLGNLLQGYQGGATSRAATGGALAGQNYQNQNAQYQQAGQSLAHLFSGGTGAGTLNAGQPQSDPFNGGWGANGAVGAYQAPAPYTQTPITAGSAQDPYAQYGGTYGYGSDGGALIGAGDPGQFIGSTSTPFDLTLSNAVGLNSYGDNSFGYGTPTYDTWQSGFSGGDS